MESFWIMEKGIRPHVSEKGGEVIEKCPTLSDVRLQL